MNVIKSNFVKQYGLLGLLGFTYLAMTYLGLGFSCPIHALTGFYCPGCGSTRAVRALLSGDLTRAFHNNALLVLSPAILTVGLVIEKYSQRRILLYTFLALVLIVVATFTIARNLDESFLAPI